MKESLKKWWERIMYWHWKNRYVAELYREALIRTRKARSVQEINQIMQAVKELEASL